MSPVLLRGDQPRHHTRLTFNHTLSHGTRLPHMNSAKQAKRGVRDLLAMTTCGHVDTSARRCPQKTCGHVDTSARRCPQNQERNYSRACNLLDTSISYSSMLTCAEHGVSKEAWPKSPCGMCDVYLGLEVCDQISSLSRVKNCHRQCT